MLVLRQSRIFKDDSNDKSRRESNRFFSEMNSMKRNEEENTEASKLKNSNKYYIWEFFEKYLIFKNLKLIFYPLKSMLMKFYIQSPPPSHVFQSDVISFNATIFKPVSLAIRLSYIVRYQMKTNQRELKKIKPKAISFIYFRKGKKTREKNKTEQKPNLRFLILSSVMNTFYYL